jgi:branched-chain amino acid transport system substrate-binding protein
MYKPLTMAALLLALAAGPAAAEMNGTLRIGVLNDMSSVYSDFQGPGSVLAAQMAVEDYAKQSKRKVEVLSADHQNKPDVGAAVAKQWFDTEGVDMVIDLPNSAVALAVSDIGRTKNKVVIGSGAGTAALTGEKCSPNFVHWTYDTWSFGHGTARGVLAQTPNAKNWFFITADYAFGHDLEKQASDEVVAEGGKVVGSVRAPLGTSDFSSFLLQAQASKADVIALANAGGDTVNTIKQARDFNITQKIVAVIFDLQSVPAVGQKAAQGLTAINAWYWDLNDQTREWSKRYAARHPKKMYPNHMQAGVYSAVLHYLKAVDKVGSPADGKAVVDAMKAMPTDDILYGKGTIREDGRKIHPLYLLQVKSPEESKGDWDVFKIVGTIPADKAFRPLAEGKCPLVKM